MVLVLPLGWADDANSLSFGGQSENTSTGGRCSQVGHTPAQIITQKLKSLVVERWHDRRLKSCCTGFTTGKALESSRNENLPYSRQI